MTAAATEVSFPMRWLGSVILFKTRDLLQQDESDLPGNCALFTGIDLEKDGSRVWGARAAPAGPFGPTGLGRPFFAPTNLPGFYPAVYPKRACNAPGLPLSDLPPARVQAGTLEAHFQKQTVQTACREPARGL
jgi:hypothetical protein